MIYSIIFLILFFIVIPLLGSYIDRLNLGNHECVICKKIKKGVTKRKVFIQYLNKPFPTETNIYNYYCDECANRRNFVIVYEEPVPEPVLDYTYIEKQEKEILDELNNMNFNDPLNSYYDDYYDSYDDSYDDDFDIYRSNVDLISYYVDCGANDKLKKKAIEKFNEISNYSSSKKYSLAKSILSKATIELVTEDSILFSFENDGSESQYYENLFIIEELLRKIYGKEYSFNTIEKEFINTYFSDNKKKTKKKKND